MRKTLLLAAAALAASVISSNAQVYSQNIVGYVNQVMPANAYTMLTAPLSVNATNGAEQVLTSLQVGDSILVWNGAGYNVSVYTGPGAWIDGTTSASVPAPKLPPGQGFFFQTGSGARETNTFVGTVLTTNHIAMPANAYSMVGSTPPIGGTIETNFSLPFAIGDSVLFWNGAGYTVSVYTGPGTWIDGTTSASVPVPNLNVAQGFFYQTGSGTAEVWNQSFTVH